MSKSALDEEESSDDEVNTVNVAEGEKKRRPGKRKVSSNKTPHPTLYENEDYSKPTRPELNMLLGSPESNVSIAEIGEWLRLYMIMKDQKTCKKKDKSGGSDKYTWVCEDSSNCHWSCAIRKNKKTGQWRIKACNDEHDPSCSGASRVRASDVAKLHLSRSNKDGFVATVLSPKDMLESAQQALGAPVLQDNSAITKYSKGYRASRILAELLDHTEHAQNGAAGATGAAGGPKKRTKKEAKKSAEVSV